MSSTPPTFKFSRQGEVTHLGVSYEQASQLIRQGVILPTDHFWTDGMSEWKLVSSQTWGVAASTKIPNLTPMDTDADPNELKAMNCLQSVLTSGEKVLFYAIQRRLFALFSRRVLVAATTGRVIVIIRGLIGGFSMQDYRWQDVADSKISTGIFGADLTLILREGNSCMVDGLRKEQAAALYRHAQSEEQAWREKLRVRQIEELRASSGGVHIGSAAPSAASAAPVSGRLAQAKQMLDDGLISDAEYEAIKAKIVSEI